MLYTVCPKQEGALRTHAAARGDDNLHRFARIPEADPFLTMENHGGPTYQSGWSDPWVFRAQGRTFMLMSKCVLADGSADPMPIYEATDDTLLHWEYKGVFFEHNGEVINFFSVGEKWVLVYSPYDAPRYFVGTLDMENLRFCVENEGILSYGYVCQEGHRGFYATCLYQNGAWESERRIMTGWLSGTKETKGWRDCMSVPREVGVNCRLQVTQMPIAELDTLHKAQVVDIAEVTAPAHIYALPSSLLDIRLTYVCDTPVTLTLTGTHTLLTLTVEKDCFSVNGDTFHVAPFYDEGTHTLRIMLDRGSAELFFGDGAVSATGFAPYAGEALTMTVTADTPVTVYRAQIFTMQEIHTTLGEELKEYE
jgi:beta-fructofuranosidase